MDYNEKQEKLKSLIASQKDYIEEQYNKKPLNVPSNNSSIEFESGFFWGLKEALEVIEKNKG